MSDAAPRPVPAVTPDMAPFWDAARRHELAAQCCLDCGAFRFPAREVCSKCLSRRAEWRRASGRGRVFSVAVMHQANHPAYEATLPYTVAQIELDCGVRMISNVVDCPAHEVAIDMPVEVVWEERSPDVVLPVFRRAR